MRNSTLIGRVAAFAAVAIAIVAVVVILLSGGSSYQVKAVFLFNFAQFVDWPAEAFPRPQAPAAFELPAPTGPYAVATTSWPLVCSVSTMARNSA